MTNTNLAIERALIITILQKGKKDKELVKLIKNRTLKTILFEANNLEDNYNINKLKAIFIIKYQNHSYFLKEIQLMENFTTPLIDQIYKKYKNQLKNEFLKACLSNI
jgi:hypothetical protein